MICRIVRAQRPHCALQPRHPYTWRAVSKRVVPLTTARTSWSLRTLQEQTIIGQSLKAQARRRVEVDRIPYGESPRTPSFLSEVAEQLQKKSENLKQF